MRALHFVAIVGVSIFPVLHHVMSQSTSSSPVYNESQQLTVVTQKKTFDEARTHCQSLLGDLVIIRDSQLQNTIKPLLDSSIDWNSWGGPWYVGYWIGGSRAPGVREWKWWDGTRLPPAGATDAYQHWIGVEPNSPVSQSACVSLTPYESIDDLSNIKGGWLDDICTRTRYFICQRDLCQPTTCQNGGTCNRLPLNYICSCLPGYSGRNCETDLCTPNPCANGGGCSGRVGDYKCLCEAGFAGRNCTQARFYSFENGCELHINKIPTQLTSHEAAETQCNSLQASLAIVKSKETQINLNQINQLWLSNVPIWLGGKLTNSTWLWADGSNMDGYNNLVDQSAPNGNDCLSLVQNGIWFAQNCSRRIGYACERIAVDGTSLCASSPCANGGVCTESGCHFHCTCQPNFNGSNCETLALSRIPAGTKLVLYIILPICVILIVVGLAVICIRKRRFVPLSFGITKAQENLQKFLLSNLFRNQKTFMKKYRVHQKVNMKSWPSEAK